jgi:hypothetical protein
VIWGEPVAERKAGKNRMHHDVVGDTAALLALGATLLRAEDGNELCCFAPDED